MRTSYNPVSSARRLSSWLMVVLGLSAYVGLIFGLTVLPVQFEVPLPQWGSLLVPPVVYGLLVLLFVRRPSVLRWLVGTAVLSGLHLLLGMAREPLTALLDPALAGRPLPWMLPPPLPELVGVFLMLVPLRDPLRARLRSARERASAAGRSSSSSRGRAVVPSRLQRTTPAESAGSLSEALVMQRSESSPEPIVAPTPVAAAAPVPPAAPAPAEEPRGRVAARAARRRETEAARPIRRSDVVLRIALDRVMGQLPPGTFLAPEDEVAASLRDPGYLLIPGELVVTQLSEGVARVAWSDIVDQFPSRLVGLGSAEISEHLGDGLRLPLDEVVSQLPHELFVAETPEFEMAGLDRIPLPFQPLEESDPAPGLSAAAGPEISPASPVEHPWAAPPSSTPVAPVVEPVVETRLVAAPVAAAVAPPAAPPRLDEPVVPGPEPVRASNPEPAAILASAPEIDEPTLRISFGRVASEIPADVFRVPLEQVAAQMRQPGTLLIPQSLVLPQLGEGLIRVAWDVVAPQFPRDQIAVSDAQMTERLPNGIRLPLDEIIRQVPLDLFMTGGPAVDVRGLESFPAPFQPLVSDPSPAPAQVAPAEGPVPPAEPERAAEPVVIAVADPVAPDVVLDDPVVHAEVAEPTPSIEMETGVPEAGVMLRAHLDERLQAVAEMESVVLAPESLSELPAVAEPVLTKQPVVPIEPQPVEAEKPEPVIDPEPIRVAGSWRDISLSAPLPLAPAAGPVETAEARRIVAMLAPIASFDVSIQTMEGVTVFAMVAPTVAPETAVTAAGLVLPLLTDRRAPWPLDQVTLRGPDTALVLTPLGGPSGRGAVLATAAPRGGGLALLEILCRRAAGDRERRVASPVADAFVGTGRNLVQGMVPVRAAGLTSFLTAFGEVSASMMGDAEGEDALYFFLPSGADLPAVGAFAQDLQVVMRKAAGSGAVFRTAVLRSGNTFLVIQPEEVGHGRSIVVVAGGDVTRPGLAYRQVERATAALVQA